MKLKGTTRREQARNTIEGLVKDKQARSHLRAGVAHLRDAQSRVVGRRPSRAIADKKLYDKVRESATSFSKAGRSLRSKPEPKRGRKLAALAAIAGGVFVALKKRKDTQVQPGPQQAWPTEAPPIADVQPPEPALSKPEPAGATRSNNGS